MARDDGDPPETSRARPHISIHLSAGQDIVLPSGGVSTKSDQSQNPVHRFGKRLRFSRAELDRALLNAAS